MAGAPLRAAENTAVDGQPAAAGTALQSAGSRTAATVESAGDAEHPLREKFTATATEIKFPGLTIDRKTHEVRMDATACLDSGILEYLVCLKGTFEHESIFVTEVQPEMLHAALLLTGFKPTPMQPESEQIWWSKILEAKESRVRIDVEWQVDGRVERTNITSMIRKNSESPMTIYEFEDLEFHDDDLEVIYDAWFFSGSMKGERENGDLYYAANYSGAIVGIWANPSAVIQYGKKTRNPYRGANQGMAVNEGFALEEGTEVKLVFTRHDPLANIR
jgi:hypothetical protein